LPAFVASRTLLSFPPHRIVKEHVKTTFLDFEQPIAELEQKIEELRFVQDDSAVDISQEIERLSKKSRDLTKDIYAKLSSWQISKVARHPQRPYTLDYIAAMCTDFEEMHGDRSFADDPAIDVGALISVFGYSEGAHRLSVRAGDLFEQTSTIDEVFVTFSCDDLEPGDDEEAIGDIEQPYDGQLFSGTMRIKGWALDWEGVNFVQVYVDGVNVGTATYGLVRSILTPVFPGYPDALAPGWEHSFATTDFSNGEHFLEVIVTDDLGHDTYIGRRRFIIANPRP